jgi:hypothetical protein
VGHRGTKGPAPQAQVVVQTIDFIEKTAAQFSVDPWKGPAGAASERLLRVLITKLSTHCVRQRRQEYFS